MTAVTRALWGLGVVCLGVVVLAVSLIRPDLPAETVRSAYANPPSAFVDIDGMAVHIRDQGPADAPAVLLLHGTFSSLHTWSGWVAALKDTHRVISMDLPGFGLTGPHPESDYSLAATLHVLESLRSRLGLERWAVAGNSLGAGYALAYAQHHPDRVTAAGLVAGGRIRLSEAEFRARQREVVERQANARGDSWMIKALNEPLVRAMLTQIAPKFLVRWALEDVYGDPGRVDEALVERYQALLRREGNRAAFVARFRSKAEDSRHAENLTEPTPPTQLPMPVLIQWGEKDTWIDLDVGIDLAAALPTSTLITYPSLGHVPMEEAPQQTAADFIAFLRAGQAVQNPAP